MNMTFIILSAALLYTTAAGMVALHAGLIARAAPRRRGAPFAVGAYLAAWVGLALAVQPRLPAALGPRLAVAGAVGFAPMFLGMALMLRSPIVAEIPRPWLIWVQSYRMLGLIFLPFALSGLVPAGFAVPAALGDFATGLAAPFVAAAVARRTPRSLVWAVAWNVFGIVDLVVAPTAALLTHANVFGVYPLAIVPLFLGPPLGILTHAVSLRNLRVSEA